MKRKPSLEYVVHWIIAIIIAIGAIGVLIQFLRYGNLVESGSIGSTGF